MEELKEDADVTPIRATNGEIHPSADDLASLAQREGQLVALALQHSALCREWRTLRLRFDQEECRLVAAVEKLQADHRAALAIAAARAGAPPEFQWNPDKRAFVRAAQIVSGG